MPHFPVLHHVPQPGQTHVLGVGEAIELSHPLSSPSPSAFNHLSIKVLSNESALCIRWPTCCSFSFTISLFNEYSGLFPLELTGWISLQSQGLLRVFFSTTAQKHPILWHSAFFMVHLSHLYMTTGKTVTLS